MTSFIFGILLTVITFVVGDVAYIITLTENPLSLGGYLVFGFFTFSPVVFFGLGFSYPREKRGAYRKYIGPVRTVRIGETYER
jgi:hypothetical protein